MPSSDRKRKAYAVHNNPCKGSYLDVNHFVIQEIAPDASVGRAISTSVPWTLSDMLGLEHSATYSLEVQNFISWLMGDIVHRLREKQPETFDGDTLLQRMLQSLTTAVEHLAVETLGQRALAVVRRREHLFSYPPKRYSTKTSLPFVPPPSVGLTLLMIIF